MRSIAPPIPDMVTSRKLNQPLESPTPSKSNVMPAKPLLSVTVTIALGDQLVEVQGVVRHVKDKAWGSIIGVEFEQAAQRHFAQVYRASRC